MDSTLPLGWGPKQNQRKRRKPACTSAHCTWLPNCGVVWRLQAPAAMTSHKACILKLWAKPWPLSHFGHGILSQQENWQSGTTAKPSKCCLTKSAHCIVLLRSLSWTRWNVKYRCEKFRFKKKTVQFLYKRASQTNTLIFGITNTVGCPVNPSSWRAEAQGSLGVQGQPVLLTELRANKGYIVKPCLKTNKCINKIQHCICLTLPQSLTLAYLFLCTCVFSYKVSYPSLEGDENSVLIRYLWD